MNKRGRSNVWAPRSDRAPPVLWPSALSRFADESRAQFQQYLIADTAPGRLMPFIPVAFAAGIILYFAAEQEPQVWAVSAASSVLVAGAVLARKRPLAFPLLLAFAAITLGFAIATIRSNLIAHPILSRPTSTIAMTGWVEAREQRERTDRIILRVTAIDELRSGETLERVRISLRKGLAPPVGSFIALKARLSPPMPAARPGGYDFARDLFFQRIGATGLASGDIKRLDGAAPSFRLRIAAAIQGLRDAIDERIRSSVPGDAGSIASALITGKRDAISANVNEAMYVSSLAHVLSISGYHMAVVAGVVFVLIRGLLALSPILATRYPIKKWAALIALIVAALYLMLSGAEVATQRAFIMTGIVLIAVMLDRAALTLRTLAVAAGIVLIIAPESIVHPSFQMSFAATLALVAGYERGLRFGIAKADTPLAARVALWGGREIVSLILASVLAGLATTPFAAYHFHRIAPYGVIANLLAMPVVSAFVMPAGLVGLVAMPFGLDGPLWRLMGEGIQWIMWVAVFVANLPGALGRMAAFGPGALLLCSAGLVFLCLLRSPLRWGGAMLIVIASVAAIRTPLPDIRISADGGTYAVRGADGRIAFWKTYGDGFALREWLAADADPRKPNEMESGDGFECDDLGCTRRLKDGAIVAIARRAEAFVEDCRRASLILSPRAAPPDCAVPVLDRNLWRQVGAVEAYRTEQGFETIVARPSGVKRPWTPRFDEPGTPTSPAAPARPAAPVSRDATPNAPDLGPED